MLLLANAPGILIFIFTNINYELRNSFLSFLFLLRKNACLLKVDRHNAKTPTLPTKVRWATTPSGVRGSSFLNEKLGASSIGNTAYACIHKTGAGNCYTFTVVTSDQLS